MRRSAPFGLGLMAVGFGLLGSAMATGGDNNEGMTLYNTKCALCHGKDGVAKPTAKGSPNLNDPKWQEATPLENIEKVIREGKGKMPKYADKLTPEQIKLIATHVKTLPQP